MEPRIVLTAPTVLPGSFGVPENSAADTVVGTVNASGVPAITSFNIISGNTDVDSDGQSAFKINSVLES